LNTAAPPKPSILPRSGVVFPAIGIVFYGATLLFAQFFAQFFGPGGMSALALPGAAFLIVLIVVMFGTVFAAVHHAEAIAHRIGEPYGTLVLTLSVTVIEATLIVSMMLSGPGNLAVARDTVFCVIMIVCNGLVGVCILIGGLRHREQEFLVRGANSYLSVIVTLAALTLMLPNYTTTILGPVFSVSQLVFVSIVTLVLYCVFLYIQTVRHTEYFTMPAPRPEEPGHPAQGHHDAPTSLAGSAALLVVSLVVVILLAKKFGVGIGQVLDRAGAPPTVSGLIVALLVLLPESMAATRAAYHDDLQKSLNLALGSSLATIGLTIPSVAAAAVVLDKSLVLGLAPKETLLLALTMVASVLTFGTGRTNVLPGLVHMVIFAAFIFLTFVP
jgi:Ca2+:H+ antiporter